MQPFCDLTGEKLLLHISRNAVKEIVRDVLLLMLFAIIIIGANVGMVMDFSRNFFILFFIPVWILMIWYPVTDIRKHREEIRSGAEHPLFQRYGSPDEIAAVLSDPSNEQVLDSRKIILTQSYLINRNDFLSYLPLKRIRSMFITHHSSRSAHYVQLMVLTKDGSRVNYNFEQDPFFSSAGKRVRHMADVIIPHMNAYAPDCEVRSMYH